MESSLEEKASSDASSDSRTESINRCITYLIHACTCRDVDCRTGMCHKMKRVIAHSKACKRRQFVGANCAVCKQLIALCCYHAKPCKQAKCQVPFCLQIREKMEEKKQSQNRQAEGMVQGIMELQISEGDGINESGVGEGAFSSFNISTLLGRDEHQVGDQSPSLMEGKPVYDDSA
uniref:histone acetyltransferase n=1 Tax=Meloidogyne javanica TaxID=6303 RepID=A0A915M387_MELJA